MEVPSSFADKFQWMEKNFPFIPPSRIVFCGDKNIVNADVLIDDRSRHFKGFRGTGILFTAPHNASGDGGFARRQLERRAADPGEAGDLNQPVRNSVLERFR